MLPTPSGSIIIGEKVEDPEDVKANHTYIVVSRNEGIVYKRIMKNAKAKNKLTLVSDNPAYQPYTIHPVDIIELWKATFIITRANLNQRWDVNQLASLVSNLQEQVTTLKNKMN